LISPVIPVARTIPTECINNQFVLCSINPNTCSTLARVFDFRQPQFPTLCAKAIIGFYCIGGVVALSDELLWNVEFECFYRQNVVQETKYTSTYVYFEISLNSNILYTFGQIKCNIIRAIYNNYKPPMLKLRWLKGELAHLARALRWQ